MKKALILGCDGQLGKAILASPEMERYEVVAVNKTDCDIVNAARVHELFESTLPDVVFHCAAYTAVDQAETDRELAYQVNVIGSENIAKEAARVHAKLVAISTDYVFSGEGDTPYTENDMPHPVSWYAQTKWESEIVVQRYCPQAFIVRSAWMFGDGNNFIRTMLTLAQTQDNIPVVCDQFGSPTYAADLATFLALLSQGEAYGIYHFTNDGFTTWAEYAQEIMRMVQLPTRIIPIPSAQYPTKAQRPKNSRLSKEKIKTMGFPSPRHWKEALASYLADEARD